MIADVSSENEIAERYERYRGIIKNFTLMSDTFMRNVFKHIECVEYVLQVIMGKKDLRVVDSVVQKDYKNLQGRSAILDCVARDVEDKRYDGRTARQLCDIYYQRRCFRIWTSY